MTITLRVERFDPQRDKEPSLIEYQVPVYVQTTVLQSLKYIYENLDPSLAFRNGCRYDRCGLCAVTVNNKPKMACFTEVSEGMTIAPLRKLPLIRDLVIDRAAFYELLSELKLFIPEKPDNTKSTAVVMSEPLRKLMVCTDCLACQSLCPEYKSDKGAFPGPYAMVQLAKLHLDPRNRIDRREQAIALGIERCGHCLQCRCLHGIDFQRHVIQVLNPRIASPNTK